MKNIGKIKKQHNEPNPHQWQPHQSSNGTFVTLSVTMNVDGLQKSVHGIRTIDHGHPHHGQHGTFLRILQ